MKIAIGIVIIALVGFGAFKVWEYWDQTEKQKVIGQQTAGGALDPRSLQAIHRQH